MADPTKQREGDQRADPASVLDRLEVLSKNPQAAMDLWWTVTGDDWPVPSDLPARFLRAAIRKGAEQ